MAKQQADEFATGIPGSADDRNFHMFFIQFYKFNAFYAKLPGILTGMPAAGEWLRGFGVSAGDQG
jgi:hypothetical protein